MWKYVQGILSHYFHGDMQILQNCTKRFICEERSLHEFKKNNNKCFFSYVYALYHKTKATPSCIKSSDPFNSQIST